MVNAIQFSIRRTIWTAALAGSAGAATLGIAPDAHACGCDPRPHVAKIVQGDPSATQQAIARLRYYGQNGLDALADEYERQIADNALQALSNGTVASVDLQRLSRLRQAIDAVAAQRDAHVSRLYWYTDLTTALNRAKTLNRPVLSLRLLGNLDDDLSCANSRFFRTVLYANREVSQHLRDNFVLHWQSLRPVPHLTIDMGDGRHIKRTITGNSIHYVLDSSGELIDAIPGLQSPASFLKGLSAAREAALASAGTSDASAKASMLRDYHVQAIAKIDQAWQEDMARLTPRRLESHSPVAQVQGAGNFPDAVRAAPVAMTKSGAELPVLNALWTNSSTPPSALIDSDERSWEQLAALHYSSSALDESSIELMREKSGLATAESAGKLTQGKRRVEDPFMRMLRTFQRSLAADTVRNEYVIHRQLHQWLANAAGSSPNVEKFNEQVYAVLFLSPLNDPWLGLAPADVYAGLDKNGLLASSCP